MNNFHSSDSLDDVKRNGFGDIDSVDAVETHAPIRATKNRVIISQEAREKRSAGGLILDVQVSKEHDRGTVVHIGDGVEGISIGDTVILSHLGVPCGENLVSVLADHVVAVLHE